MTNAVNVNIAAYTNAGGILIADFGVGLNANTNVTLNGGTMALSLGTATTAREAVTFATKKGYLRQNSVDSLTGKNDGTNVGPGSPILHFHQQASPEVSVRLVLKGGGCENVGAQ